MEPFLLSGEFFNPVKIGLPHLLDESPNEDDHVLHEIVDMQPVTEGEPIMTGSELVRRFKDAHLRGWFS